VPGGGPWSHNLHYHRLVLGQVPAGCRRALDVGCGEGQLARALADRVPAVVGLDRDAPTLDRARRAGGPGGLAYVLGDLLDAPFPPGSFDLVASIATLHHGDTGTGLRRLRDLVRPRGRLVVVGLARSRSLADVPYDVAGYAVSRVYRRTRAHEPVTAPTVWPPPLTYGQTRRTARAALPGVRYGRHLFFRYSLTWDDPGAAQPTGPG
jgi:SAM-dependent methyltransferase